MDDDTIGEMNTVAGRPSQTRSSVVAFDEMLTMQKPVAGQGGAPLNGTPLSERYELLEEIGHGGFAQVWKARDKKLGRLVAIKRLKMEVLGGAEGNRTLERFTREAGAIAQLNHRNIVQVYDNDADADGHYVVMELVEGGTLRDYLKSKKEGKLSEAEAVGIVKGIAQGLGCAHKKNLVHRDIKPSNILLSFEGNDVVPKIVDFGLARMGSDSELSVSGYGMGTPYYMPPEQRRDAKSVNHTADIYALGKVLYELCSGELPDIVDPEKVSPVLAKVVLKCVKTKPEERYFSTEELILGLDALAPRSDSPSALNQDRRSVGANAHACPSCGRVNPESVRFCKSCGAGLVRRCPECGDDTPIFEPFCGKCGTEYEGFLKTSALWGRMRSLADEKRWSGVLDEAQKGTSGVKLSGKKGKELLSSIEECRKNAADAMERRDRANADSEQLLGKGMISAAVRASEKSLEVDPHQETVVKHHTKLLELQKFDSERERLRRAADFDGALAVVRQMTEAGLPEDAAKALAEALNADLKKLETSVENVRLMVEKYNLYEAVAAWAEVSRLWPDSKWIKTEGENFTELLRLDGERKRLYSWADFAGVADVVSRMAKAGLPECAVKELSDELERKWRELESVVSEAEQLAEEKKLAAAARKWTEASSLCPESDCIRLAIAEIEAARLSIDKHIKSAKLQKFFHKYKSARTHVLQALELNPFFEEALGLLGILDGKIRRRLIRLRVVGGVVAALVVLAVILGVVNSPSNTGNRPTATRPSSVVVGNRPETTRPSSVADAVEIDSTLNRGTEKTEEEPVADGVTGAEEQFRLGVGYYKGDDGQKQDYEKAVQCFQKSAAQGYPWAQYYLGFCHQHGQGVAKDIDAASSWYRKAGMQGLVEAQAALDNLQQGN